MMNWFRSLFGGATAASSAQPGDPAELAAAALLVQAALADGIYAEAEQTAIQTILTRSFSLSDEAAWALLDRAEGEAEAASDHYRFTRDVMTLDESRRIAFVRHMFEVANADGDACAFEDAFVRRVAGLLHVSDRDRAAARAAAREGSA